MGKPVCELWISAGISYITECMQYNLYSVRFVRAKQKEVRFVSMPLIFLNVKQINKLKIMK